MLLSEFDYDLPEELIAQTPIEKRDESRLLVLHKENGEIEHKIFRNVIDYLEPGDCLVMNDSRVIPARLFAYREDRPKEEQNPVEIFLIRPHADSRWECMVRPGKKVKKGRTFVIEDLKLQVTDELENGNRMIEFIYDGNIHDKLFSLGEMPLPPYIHEKLKDPERYQTVYSKEEGSVAAPTAGLHFTKELIEKIKEKGVNVAYVTLHVGIGTFRPVKTQKIEDHKMHSEYYIITEENIEKINRSRSAGKRIIAVGTTSCRVLESVASMSEDHTLKPCCGETDIFIYPGYDFKILDGLITNFHLPQSTLLMLVSAFAGKDKIMKAYSEAIDKKYRFFSFGDAMLII